MIPSGSSGGIAKRQILSLLCSRAQMRQVCDPKLNPGLEFTELLPAQHDTLRRRGSLTGSAYRWHRGRMWHRTGAVLFRRKNVLQRSQCVSPADSAGSPWRTYLNIVPLQSQARSGDLLDGSVAQLNRASDYGSEGYRFESYPSHFPTVAQAVSECG